MTSSAHLFANPSLIPFSWREPIHFMHPGYREPTNELLALPRVEEGSDTSRGVHHATALLACQIIANNAFEGRLYLDRDAIHPVDTPRDGVLCAAAYYFHVPHPPPPLVQQQSAVESSLLPDMPASVAGVKANPYRYPIVPRFSDWRFPHDSFSQLGWPSPAPVLPSGRFCAITGASWGLTNAHLVPRHEWTWYRRNAMASRAGGIDLHAPGNVMVLRDDIHMEMDARAFALVPWTTASRERSGAAHSSPSDTLPGLEYTVSILGTWTVGTSQLAALYHRHPLQSHPELSPQCLFARFAWTVFQQVKIFLTNADKGVPMAIVRWEDGPPILEDLDAKTLVERYGGGGSRSTSSTKSSREQSSAPARKRPADGDGGQEEEDGVLGEPWVPGNHLRDRSRSRDSQERRDHWCMELVGEIEEELRGRTKKRRRWQHA